MCIREPTELVEPRNRRYSSIYIPSSRPHLHYLFLLYWTHCQQPELSWHHVTWTKHLFSFQNTPNILHCFSCSLWASIRYMQLHHNANTSDVDSFSTPSDGTKGQPQRNGEWNCWGKNANNGYISRPDLGSGQFESLHLETHPCRNTDIQCLRHQGWEGMGPLLWYNHSWSSHDSPAITITANVAAPQQQVFAFSLVVRSLLFIYGANVWQNPRPNEQLEAGKHLCLRGSM